MSDSYSNNSTGWTTALATLGGFSIFAIILVIAYLPKKPAPLPEGSLTPEQRSALLTEVRSAATAANTYGWVDQTNGVARLPIDRAVELTIQELNAKK